MTNHVHLLVTPDGAESCALLMKRVGQLYVQHVNRVHRRTGTLWEGRFRSSAAATEHYAIACHRYIELNPVRAGMVTHARDYPWSSYRGNAEGREDPLLTPHPAYLALGIDHEGVRRAYQSLFDISLESRLIEDIRCASRDGRPLGAERPPRGRPPEKNREK
jgi:putative transposase